jgi:drug/metabolite transporter (DMT)-like permease
MNTSLKFSRRHHLIFFLQGTSNFCLNYIITYKAQMYSPSAIIALTFTTLVHLNMLGSWLFFRKRIHKNVFIGAGFGAVGIFLLFYEDMQKMNFELGSAYGIVLGIVATVFASLGNMLSYKNYLMKVPVMSSNAWGMFYGMVSTGIICLFLSETFVVPTTFSFWAALLYLSIFGTVVAFGAYITLIHRIGAERAAYTSIASPVIAVSASALFLVGMTLCLVGNFFTLYRSGALAAPKDAPP